MDCKRKAWLAQLQFIKENKCLMKYYIFIIVSCLIGHYALAQTAPDTNLLTKTWKAGWIGVTEEAKHAYGTYLFKKSAKLDQVPARYVVHVSADNQIGRAHV